MVVLFIFFTGRKKVGNFIAGNDTSQTQQTDQQAKGKHTPLPEDQYVFPGIRYTLHFVTVDVTTIGQSEHINLLMDFDITSDADDWVSKVNEE